MATGADLRRLALALEGTSEHPHFDRAAFKVARTYVTLAADGMSANLRLTPEQQQFKCMLAPTVFRPIDNAWGRQGWTVVDLSAIDLKELSAVLTTAWADAQPKSKAKPKSRAKSSAKRPRS